MSDGECVGSGTVRQGVLLSTQSQSCGIGVGNQRDIMQQGKWHFHKHICCELLVECFTYLQNITFLPYIYI